MKLPLWMNKKIASPDDANRLHQEAAVLEFGHRLPRAEAEARAYENYKQDRHGAAAAYHVLGMKAASVAGNKEDAKKHWLMYQAHVQALGGDKKMQGKPAPEVERHLERETPYRFKPHAADAFVVDDVVNKHECEWEGCSDASESTYCDIHRRPGLAKARAEAWAEVEKLMKNWKPEAAVKPLPNQQLQDWSGHLEMYDVNPRAYSIRLENVPGGKKARLFHHGEEVGGLEVVNGHARSTVPGAHAHALPAMRAAIGD